MYKVGDIVYFSEKDAHEYWQGVVAIVVEVFEGSYYKIKTLLDPHELEDTEFNLFLEEACYAARLYRNSKYAKLLYKNNSNKVD